MTNEERIAEWLFLEDWDKEKGWAYANEYSGDWKEVSPEGRPHYLRIARSLLTFLDSLGFVQQVPDPEAWTISGAYIRYNGTRHGEYITVVKSILAQEGK
jgi:hypothetical protein